MDSGDIITLALFAVIHLVSGVTLLVTLKSKVDTLVSNDKETRIAIKEIREDVGTIRDRLSRIEGRMNGSSIRS